MRKDNEIEKYDYSRLVGLLGERNRPSGGIKTVHEVIVQSRINESSVVLEIGSNTGFTSVQIARVTGAHVYGIDINTESIMKSERYAKEHGVGRKVSFLNGSATDIPFEDRTFDVVWASNVTSFLNDKQKAISEYLRVLKPNGYLVFVPIYYVDIPPDDLVQQVGEAIGCELKMYTKEDWLQMVQETSHKSVSKLELVYESDMRYHDRSEILETYVHEQLTKIEKDVSSEVLEVVKKRYGHQINLFNENLKYAGYSVLLFQKNDINEDTELFLTYKL